MTESEELAAARIRLAEHEEALARHARTLEDLHLHQEELRAQNEELRIAQSDLDSIRRSYQDLFDFDPVAHFLVDSRGRIRKFNHAARSLLGWDGRQLDGHVLANLAHTSQQRDAISVFLDDHLKGRAPPPLPVTLIGKNGLNITVELYGGLYESSYIPGVRLTAVDVSYRAAIETERRRAEDVQRARLEHLVDERTAELAAAEARYRGLVEQSQIGICIVREGALRYANPALLDMFGYTASGAMIDRQFLRDLVPQDRREHVDHELTRLHSGEVAECHLDLPGHHRDGRPMYFEARGRLIEHEGRPASIWAILDVTERKRGEQERANLEHQLNRAHKMEALGRLTGGIAHDFNNILAAMLGYAELSLATAGTTQDDKLVYNLGQIVRAGSRARDLVAKMLAYSRKQPGTTTHAIAPAPEVRDVVRILAAAIPAGIELAETIEDDLPPIQIGPIDLHQVLMNLVLNARDALGEHGRIEITLKRVQIDQAVCALRQEPFAGEFIELAVTDTGIGMDPTQLTHIFDPFYTTKDIGQGSGLGLSVTQGIVLDAGGHILVESALGRGSRFRLLFPILDGAEPCRADSPPETATTHRKGRIWVVDDEEMITEYLAELLTVEGHAVTRFGNPLDALAAYGEKPDGLDLLITDQAMPGLSGHELASAMLQTRPELPVIICTGHSDHLDAAGARALGIRHFLAKPVMAIRLLTLIDTELANADQAPNRQM